MSRAFGYWIPIVVATSGLFVASYWAVQQNYRITFNDPQIQMAEDAAAALVKGANADQVVPQGKVDLRASLAPWLAIYNAQGVPLRSSGELDGAPPQLPQGVFDPRTWHRYGAFDISYSVPQGEDRFTWQPRSDVRQAVALVHAEGNGVNAYVAAGRNMREVEEQESVLARGMAIAWGVSELATLAAILFLISTGFY